MNQSTFRITTKLIIGVSFLAILAIAFSAISLFYINKIEIALNEVTDSAAPTVETADDLVMNIWEANKVAEEIIADEEMEDIYELIEEFNEFEIKFNASYEELDLLVNDPDLLDELHKVKFEHLEFIKNSNFMFEAHILELEEEINSNTLLNDFDSIGATLISMLSEFSDENEAEMAKIEEEADRMVEAKTASVEVLNDLIGNLFEDDYPVVEAALKLQKIVMEMQDTAGEFMATETELDTQGPSNDFQNLAKSTKQYFEILHSHAESLEDEQDAIEIERIFNNWVTTASKEEQLFDTHLDMLKAEYSADAAAEYLELDADTVAKTLDIVIEKADKLSRSADDEAAGIVSHAQAVTFGFIIMSVLVVITLIVFVIRSVTSPISNMTKVMKELANHNFDIDIPNNTRNDEIGNMASALSVFKDSMIKADELAYYDVLTGLPNRTLFYNRLEKSFRNAERDDTVIALLFLDLDNFKILNDTHGHSHGDELLRLVADRLLSCVRDCDTVSRLGGDEFTIVLSDIEDVQRATQVASIVSEKLVGAFSEEYSINGQYHNISASVGIALYPKDGNSLSELVKHADTAMYQAKSFGKNCYRFFSLKMFEQQNEKLKLIDDIDLGLKEDQFVLFYQPQISLSTNDVVGFEALIRWQHPERGLLDPSKFIPFAEQTGQIVAIGEWTIKTAMAQLSQWHEDGNKEWEVSVNLSVNQVRHNGLLKFVREQLDIHQIDPEKFCFEITETMMNEDTIGSKKVLGELKNMGFKVSLDDFGTGYSSMTYIKHFPVDELKIDRFFIKDMFDSLEDKAIILASLSLASLLGVRTVAEGVETKEQLEFLKENGCDYIQGYFIAKPMPVSDIYNWNELEYSAA